MYDKENIFAKIIRKEIPCNVIYEDNKTLFFNDINPQAKIHILGIPKLPVINFYDFMQKADSEMVNHFFLKINDIVNSYELNNSGFRIITNNGKNAHQEVPHFHIHILGGEFLKGLN